MRRTELLFYRTMLTWKAPESSPDIRYRVHYGQVMSGHELEETVSETGECHYSLALLEHAKQFTCRVCFCVLPSKYHVQDVDTSMKYPGFCLPRWRRVASFTAARFHYAQRGAGSTRR